MIARQVAKQIQFILRNLKWDETGANKVFGNDGGVRITELPTEEALKLIAATSPFALIAIDSAPSDSETPSLFRQMFTITIGQCVANDDIGEITKTSTISLITHNSCLKICNILFINTIYKFRLSI